MTEIPEPSRYANINIDVDIVFGKKTFGAVRKSSKALKTIWKHANEIEIPEAGHLPIQEQTELMAQLIFK